MCDYSILSLLGEFYQQEEVQASSLIEGKYEHTQHLF